MTKQRKLKNFFSIVVKKKNSVFLILILICVLFLVLFRTYLVNGISMSPTLEDGDKIFVKKRKIPTRWDIITLKPEDNPQESYVKRVVGMPGDSLVLEGNSLRVSYLENGHKKSEKITVTDGVAMILEKQHQIPADKYFVLGDNRNHSNDSRSFGLINGKKIEGVVCWRYYPLDRVGSIK